MKPPIFVGGCPRSGTTLLGLLLASHTDCLGSIENTYLDDVGWVRDLRGNVLGSLHGRHWVDHAPSNVVRAPQLLARFPDARFVHIVRDGRAVWLSAKRLDNMPNLVSEAAAQWSLYVACGLALFREHPGQVLTVQYEDLVTHRKRTLTRICEFAGLEYMDDLFDYYHLLPTDVPVHHDLLNGPIDTSRADAWRTELAPREIETFEAYAGALLDMLGYDRCYEHPRPLRFHERLWDGVRGPVIKALQDRRKNKRKRGLVKA